MASLSGKQALGSAQLIVMHVRAEEDAPAALDIDFLFESAETFNNTGTTVRLSGDAGVAAMKSQPVMAIDLKLIGYNFQQLLFNLLDILIRGELRVITDAKNVGIYSDSGSAKGGI